MDGEHERARARQTRRGATGRADAGAGNRRPCGCLSRDELESQLTELRDEQEELAAGYDVDSLDEFRGRLAEENFSAAELRERRNVIATWEAINTELGLVKHALQLYDDVVELSSPRTDSHSPLA